MRERFAWDKKKNKANQLKHRIGFEAAMLVFDDPTAISVQDRDTEGEQRWITVGWFRIRSFWSHTHDHMKQRKK